MKVQGLKFKVKEPKTYQISDLFFTKWEEVPHGIIPSVYVLQKKIESITPEHKEYGYVLIAILRLLRKRPILVDKINEAQAVDIYNDLAFLKKPWFFFPDVKGSKFQVPGLQKPEDHLSRHTFDHFIYADNEFSMYLATQDVKYLKRLVATLYQDKFDKEVVPELAAKLKAKDWQLQSVFYTYANVREFVAKRCKTLLPPTRPSDSPEGENSARKQTPTGALWLKIKHRLSETPAFQGYDNAGRANMYSALDYLEDLAQQKENAKS